ncbi:MAG: NAD(P)-dependent alcohol dehydrogenase [Woeseiaceae bacterium]|nr:NAD(P)-dependent alcohol dehydrogenase [Woeseiaceae bacterium]
MKAAQARCYGSPDIIEIVDVAKPTPEDDEVLVKVMAASVNPLDWHFLRGSPYLMRLMSGIGRPNDASMGVDFAGTVEAVGKNVTRFQPGDEVFGGRDGAFAEYLTVSESKALAMKPANMSFQQAAAVPIAGVTAIQALRDSGKIKPGQTVLINGASGGVGTFAVQIAKSLGAEVTAVCSTRNLELVRSIGADHAIDYKMNDYMQSDQRYDLIIDMVGNHGLLANKRMLEPNGSLIMVGGGKGNWIGPLMGPIKALMLSPFVDQKLETILAQLGPDDLLILGLLMQSGQLTPVIDRSYRLGELADAIRYSEEGHARGKIIIDMQ